MDKEYIEREAAKRELLSWAVCMNHPEYLMKDDAMHVIDSIPAADVECCGRLRGVTYEDGEVTAVHIRDTDDVVKVFTPVRHGRWIKAKESLWFSDFDCVFCSNCNETWIADEDTGFDFLDVWNYCPNCGAKMDGGED